MYLRNKSHTFLVRSAVSRVNVDVVKSNATIVTRRCLTLELELKAN